MSDFLASQLHNENTFYKAFSKDLKNAKKEVVIESPYITRVRANKLIPILNKLLDEEVNIIVITRNPDEHDENMAYQAEEVIAYFEQTGIQVLLCDGGHHRKLAMIDRKILWEGSLNILSQTHSREFMRRIENEELTEEAFKFLKFDQVRFFGG
ncbi:hypothetical protein A2631_02300 [Candidatus Daviesbacteria bacterium RIFCSPHIGHO2_01_FULL_44_29]|uniref:Phospholipase D-like domain-containing protein n=1 Tax=Candidatus Daviesbacteria bacterium RIFCSPHIGHO2_02_FULL_43_12 TaxID=1797776 RepID=A0A1F5KJX7_9BACT|nr:MAG: hypothetical protein A2631_02300 [Candidatus Daviesbacteria bacterium RIFCSPHIGHO2_01_FULL_44_29]OGE40992.1 MAG: hypothetical protein A3E86_03655 [Candidatus Daviesbacteria bacterium RIFCSPHIGHO2_12_FULL_47_45]OGE41223.1 MAG: hypothetical protein A3D25_01695 [Candidatus Daviesbacteria bacterium RIFCSPHIGHO2_02_FULL_43_12]OGE69423.1 MAG: hypothetical protein A3B55_03435 [Candidatus Daviesbacteria bacterium RIFCSPLOWO2_01_FULL_43_15]